MLTTFLLFGYASLLVGSLYADTNSKEQHTSDTVYAMENKNTTYTKHILDDGTCSVALNHSSQILNEGQLIKIHNKLFKVENCRLSRAYRAKCGSTLFYRLIHIACSIVEQKHHTPIQTRRQIEHDHYAFLKKLLFTPCCKTACTVYEIVQYCSAK